MSSRRATFEDVSLAVSRVSDPIVTVEDLASSRRLAFIVRARHAAFALSREVTGRSLAEIGKFYGGRDHSTVLYGIKRATDEVLEPARAELARILGSPPASDRDLSTPHPGATATDVEGGEVGGPPPE